MSKVCIIIPFYNEAKRLDRDGFISFLNSHSDYSLMLVNDGSTDHTLSILEELHQCFPQQIQAYSLPQNVGKAEAVRLGVLKALNWQNFDILGYMDADLATPLEEAPYLVSHFAQSTYQLVFGSRVQLFGWNIKRSLKRHYLGRIFATFVSLLFKLDIYDTQCGAKFFRNDIASDLFTTPFVSRWFFDIELFLRLRQEMGAELFQQSLLEVPLKQWTEKGESKLKLEDFLNTPFELYRIKNRYR